MMDRFSRYVKCVCLPEITAPTVAMAIRNHWLLEHGSPECILSDRASYFTGYIFQILTRITGIDHKFTSAYHPETNGRLERFHRFLKQRLRIIAHTKGLDFLGNNDWDVFVPNIAFSYNVTPSRVSGGKYSPYDMIYGAGSVRLPLESAISRSTWDIADDVLQDRRNLTGPFGNPNFKTVGQHNAFIRKMEDQRVDMYEYVRYHNARYQSYQKEKFDKSRIPPIHYYNMEIVWVDTSDREVGNAAKLRVGMRIVMAFHTK